MKELCHLMTYHTNLDKSFRDNVVSVDSNDKEWEIGNSSEDGVHHCHALLVVHAEDVVSKQLLRLVGGCQNEWILEKSKHLLSVHDFPQSLIVDEHADALVELLVNKLAEGDRGLDYQGWVDLQPGKQLLVDVVLHLYEFRLFLERCTVELLADGSHVAFPLSLQKVGKEEDIHDTGCRGNCGIRLWNVVPSVLPVLGTE